MNLNQFVNTGADSATVNNMKKSIAREADLQKAMNRAGLVQKEVQVQGKNGTTFTRKQWVKASDVSNNDNSKANKLSSYEGKTDSEMRVIFDGKTAADVQDEKARIFESLGRPGNGNPKRKEFERATAPLGRLIGDTINNGTGDASRDYDTLLKTSRVKASDTDKKSLMTKKTTDSAFQTQSPSKSVTTKDIKNNNSQKFKPSDFGFRAGGQKTVSIMNDLDKKFGIKKHFNGAPGFGTAILNNESQVGFGYDDTGAYIQWQGQKFRSADELSNKWGGKLGASDTEKISPRCKRNLDRALQNRDSFVDIKNEYKEAVDKLVKESKATGTSDFRKRNIQQDIKSLNNELSYITKKFEERELEDSKPNLDSKESTKETKSNPFSSIKPKDKDDIKTAEKISDELDKISDGDTIVISSKYGAYYCKKGNYGKLDNWKITAAGLYNSSSNALRYEDNGYMTDLMFNILLHGTDKVSIKKGNLKSSDTDKKGDGSISDRSSSEYDSLFKKDASQDSKRQTLKSLLGSGHSREDIMSQAKKMGVNWKHSDHPGINWMRASMAITGITTKGNKGEM